LQICKQQLKKHGYGFEGDGDKTLKDIETTAGFAWFIANFKDKYLAATADEILYRVGNRDGILYTGKANGTTDINYYTCECVYHTQADDLDLFNGDGWARIVNVIEIETPGKITIYKRGVDKPVTIDISNHAKAKEMYQKIKNNSDAELTAEEHTNMKRNLTMFAYAAQQIPDEPYTSSWYGYNAPENIMEAYWNLYDVRKYMKATGLLDGIFNHYEAERATSYRHS